MNAAAQNSYHNVYSGRNTILRLWRFCSFAYVWQ